MWVEQQIEEYRRAKAALAWLDAHCWIEATPFESLRPLATWHETRQVLARYGIHRAIVSHSAARDYDAAAGNRLLLEAIADLAGFWGAAVLVPDDSGEGEVLRRLRSLVAGKVRLMRIFPRSHNWSLSEWCAGLWLDAMEAFHLPIAVWHTEADWNDVAAVCAAHPRLPVIVEGPNRKLLYHNRIYYRLLERFENFHLEIHNLVGYLGLDDVVRRFGAERLVFGTYFPHQDPNVAMTLVTHGQLNAAEQAHIACGNIERLIAAVSTVEETP